MLFNKMMGGGSRGVQGRILFTLNHSMMGGESRGVRGG